MWRHFLLIGLATCVRGDGHFLRSIGGNNGLKYFIDKHGQRIFLSGANLAWVRYCNDFGNDGWASGKTQMEGALRDIRSHGGNSIRVWLHCEGKFTPKFNHQGGVDGLERYGSHMIADLLEFLKLANAHKILVFPVLWNGAQPSTPELKGLLASDPAHDSFDKMGSYLTHLKNMVTALKEQPALGGWEIINEFNGILNPHLRDSGCHDPAGFGGGWAVKSDADRFSMRQLQRFISRQAKAIHDADPMAQITASIQDVYHVVNANWGKNFLSDSCLSDVGGGRLTFYEIHTYAMNNAEYDKNSPVFQSSSHWGLDKPLVVGEFSQSCSHSRSAVTLFTAFYDHQFAGAWIWEWKYEPSGSNECRGDWNEQLSGMSAIQGKTNNGYCRIPDNVSLA